MSHISRQPLVGYEKGIERISIPQDNIHKFKEVFIYIINKIGTKPNIGQTVLYKLLYFIDFNYYELYEEQLIGAKYIKNKYGPTPVGFAKIIQQMQKDGDCEEVKIRTATNFFRKKYSSKRQADLSGLSEREIEHINDTLDKYSDKSAKELSKLSHKDVPWISAKYNEIIDYEGVFYRTDDTSVRKYEAD